MSEDIRFEKWHFHNKFSDINNFREISYYKKVKKVQFEYSL